MPGQKALHELGELHHEFLAFGAEVEELLAAAVRALRAPDPNGGPAPGTGAALVERGHRITDRCRRIGLLYQPVALDFRDVTAIFRMALELEHIGTRASAIAGWSSALAGLPVPEELDRLADVCSSMVHRAVDAYALLDAGALRPVPWSRTEVSALAQVLMDWLPGVMRADPAAVEPGLALCAVVRGLVDVADHAVALAEEVVCLTEGADTGTATGAPLHARSGS
jgi:phosphate transport system protein